MVVPTPARPVFIAGCQRSGTTMLGQLLARSPLVRVYHEGDPAAFERYRLRGEATIRGLLAASPAPFVVFKAICDSQWADRLLATYPDARLVWIYRDYRDVAASALHKWQGRQAEVMQQIRTGTLERENWRVERLDDRLMTMLRDAHAGPLPPATGAALFWFIRNWFFSGLGLAQEPRALLVRYEALARQPPTELARLERFLDLPPTPEMRRFVHGDSVSRGRELAVAPMIDALCAGTLAALDHFRAQR